MTDSESILKARGEKEKDIRRQHILDSAEAVMNRVGLNKLSISAVAREAKLAQGTLYLYFEKKEDIIGQLTLKSRERLLQAFHDGISETDHPLQQIRNILVANLKFYQENKLYHDLVSFYEVNAGLAEPPELEQASRDITSLVISVLDRAKAQKLVRSSLDPTEFAFIMWGASIGMVQLIDVKDEILVETLNKPAAAVYESYVDFVIQGLKV